jgi:hypothetical protein
LYFFRLSQPVHEPDALAQNRQRPFKASQVVDSYRRGNVSLSLFFPIFFFLAHPKGRKAHIKSSFVSCPSVDPAQSTITTSPLSSLPRSTSENGTTSSRLPGPSSEQIGLPFFVASASPSCYEQSSAERAMASANRMRVRRFRKVSACTDSRPRLDLSKVICQLANGRVERIHENKGTARERESRRIRSDEDETRQEREVGSQ